jgi:phage shock protein E
MASITPAELLARIDRQEHPAIVDVRTAAEFAAGHVPGAVNIPFQQMPGRTADVSAVKSDDVVVYCGHGPRAWIAGAALRRAGFRRIVYLRGHWAAWRRAGFRTER